jgi:hypothetical protein
MLLMIMQRSARVIKIDYVSYLKEKITNKSKEFQGNFYLIWTWSACDGTAAC